ncbi:hypothetical protein EJ03DRAFT_338382 [Teratosphaeria nubilosa]|uniref:Uncharacterized protein n=1 Tax=Teratosphaeria nubilosa TaxID=161662 RepID=A0A6G1L136_9PEZI|nr:hypothetical protein EJ03DRAFT_338382 [Teratosphaeria nubilosa]
MSTPPTAAAAINRLDGTFPNLIAQGSIAYLPTRRELENRNIARGGTGIPEVKCLDRHPLIVRFQGDGQPMKESSCFGHPILVLSRPPASEPEPWIDFLIMTTLHGQTPQQHYPNAGDAFLAQYVPLQPGTWHQYYGRQHLTFAAGMQLDREGRTWDHYWPSVEQYVI